METERLRVIVVMGGRSAEHDVSLDSGHRVAEGLTEAGHEVGAVVIGRNGRWHLGDDASTEVTAVSASIEALVDRAGAAGDEGLPLGRAVAALSRLGADVVFVALHGEFGEDGTIQGMLDLAGLPYTGAGVLGSSLAMDKVRSRWIFEHHGLLVPCGTALSAEEWRLAPDAVAARVGRRLPPPPWFVKPADRGSSVGVTVVARAADLDAAVEAALDFSDWVLVEELVEGDEVTCGVLDRLDGGDPEALPVTEILPREDEFFDYHAKYTPGATEEITPARLPDRVQESMRDAAVRAHLLLRVRGMSRTDAIVRDGVPYLLEVNTIPGMTGTSLLPQGAAAAGISFPELLDRIARLGIRQSRRRQR